MRPEDKQKLLEEDSLTVKLDAVSMALTREIEVLELKGQIQSKAEKEMTDAQREYMLRQQLKAIQSELGEGESEAAEIRKRVTDAELPETVAVAALREVDRLERMTPASPEYQMIRTYLDWVLDIPWSKTTEDRLDPIEARRVLDEDHYDLDKVKERIVEYLAVQKLRQSQGEPSRAQRRRRRRRPNRPRQRSPQPAPRRAQRSRGEGRAHARTDSLLRRAAGRRQDVARPVDRPGDEPEVRAHVARRRARRSRDPRPPPHLHRLDARPARSGAEAAGSANPVLMLDEIDKITVGIQGDPAAALLEVLDPAQNHTFRDHYIEIPIDLSRVLFIATANQLGTIHPALLDRMELISLSGYTEEEKVHIARLYLVPRQLEENGLTPSQLHITDDGLRRVITRVHAGGGRANARAADRDDRAEGGGTRRHRGGAHGRASTCREVRDYLGPPRFRSEAAFRTSRPGVATGVAWTEAGGDVLFIEAVADAGGAGQLTLTGQLGRRHAGVRSGGAQPHPPAGERARHPGGLPEQAGPAHPRARRRDTQGRSVGRRDDGHRHRLGRARRAGRARRRDDR